MDINFADQGTWGWPDTPSAPLYQESSQPLDTTGVRLGCRTTTHSSSVIDSVEGAKSITELEKRRAADRSTGLLTKLEVL